MGGVEFLDHFNAGAAVFGDLIDVGSFHEPETYISVAQGIGGTPQAFPVCFEFLFAEDGIEVMSNTSESSVDAT